MPYALEIFLDQQADATVRNLWRNLERLGIPTLRTASHARHHPHVTLAIAEQPIAKHLLADDNLLKALKPLPGQRLNFPLLGVFPGAASVLFLGAQVTAPLLAAHANVHAAIAAITTTATKGSEPDDDLGRLYKPDSWVPHCTLAMDLDAESLAHAYRELHPYAGLRAHIERVGLVDMETGDVKDLVGN